MFNKDRKEMYYHNAFINKTIQLFLRIDIIVKPIHE